MTDREIIKILKQRRDQIESADLSDLVVREYDYMINFLYRMLDNELEEEYQSWRKSITPRKN